MKYCTFEKLLPLFLFNWIRSLNMENEENVLNFMNRNDFKAGFEIFKVKIPLGASCRLCLAGS